MAIYVKIEGIDGEATQQDHQKWIDVRSIQFGFGRAISTPTGSAANREASQPSVSEVVVNKGMDASSAKLFTEAVTGNKGKTVNIDLVSTGSPGNTYASYTLTNALVSAYSMSSTGDTPSEQISPQLHQDRIQADAVRPDQQSGYADHGQLRPRDRQVGAEIRAAGADIRSPRIALIH